MKEQTSWEAADQWYDRLVGKEGHYHHQKSIIPGVLRLLNLAETPSPALLDLACGQGVLARAIPKGVPYQGVDLSPSLLRSAKEQTKRPNTHFTLGDICKPLPIKQKDFTHATILLAIQNVEEPAHVFAQAAAHLQERGTFVIVLNHPCFRIPRQSHWGIDETQKIQYRRIDRYLSSLKIPIQMHPGRGKMSETTWSFHHSLSTYSKWLMEAGFAIVLFEEWTSDKKSTGKYAKMENRAREEFPLFLAIKAQKM